jgi:hypothetical protein
MKEMEPYQLWEIATKLLLLSANMRFTEVIVIIMFSFLQNFVGEFETEANNMSSGISEKAWGWK